jgi:hypothetical protein
VAQRGEHIRDGARPRTDVAPDKRITVAWGRSVVCHDSLPLCVQTPRGVPGRLTADRLCRPPKPAACSLPDVLRVVGRG